MRRILCMVTFTLVGVVLTLVTNEARQDRHAIRQLEIADNLYMLTSDPADTGMRTGGNTVVFVTSDGVSLVDTKIKGYGQDILAEVRKITDKPITTIINTHTHWDHSGSNAEFPDTVHFVAHENTYAHMSQATCDDGRGFEGGSITNCETFQGDNKKYLPKTVFSVRTSLFSGPDQIDLYYFGRGHTDGDTWVVFKAARVMHTGDMFARKGLPYLVVENTNGSAIEFGATLKKAVAGIQDVDILIPGHNDDPLTWNDLVDYSGFYDDLLSKAQAGAAAGQSVEDVVGSYTVPDQYSEFVSAPDRVTATVQHVFDGH